MNSFYALVKDSVSGIYLWNALLTALLMVPNIIYALKFRGEKKSAQGRLLTLTEQTGRYASLFFMLVPCGFAAAFASFTAFAVYVYGSALLIVLYESVWVSWFKKQTLFKSMALALIPSALFLLCAVMLRHIPFIVSALLFSAAHTAVTYRASCPRR